MRRMPIRSNACAARIAAGPGLAARQHGWTLRKSAGDYAFMLLSALEGASFIGWALGPSTDPLAAFHHLLDSMA
jgi:TetR/AcrR family transcriptional repressor of nem operon